MGIPVHEKLILPAATLSFNWSGDSTSVQLWRVLWCEARKDRLMLCKGMGIVVCWVGLFHLAVLCDTSLRCGDYGTICYGIP